MTLLEHCLFRLHLNGAAKRVVQLEFALPPALLVEGSVEPTLCRGVALQATEGALELGKRSKNLLDGDP